MNGAGRRWGEFWNPSRLRPRAQSRAGIEYPRARGPYMAGCELSPATVLRAAAQAKYSKHFRAAYGTYRLRPEAPHRTSSTKSPVPLADRCRDADLPIAATSAAARRREVLPDRSDVRTHAQLRADAQFTFGHQSLCLDLQFTSKDTAALVCATGETETIPIAATRHTPQQPPSCRITKLSPGGSFNFMRTDGFVPNTHQLHTRR